MVSKDGLPGSLSTKYALDINTPESNEWFFTRFMENMRSCRGGNLAALIDCWNKIYNVTPCRTPLVYPIYPSKKRSHCFQNTSLCPTPKTGKTLKISDCTVKTVFSKTHKIKKTISRCVKVCAAEKKNVFLFCFFTAETVMMVSFEG